MSNVIHLPTSAKSKKQWADEVYSAIMRGDKVAVVVAMPDEVWTAYHNCDCGDKQVLLGHMQVDIIHASMAATYTLDPLD